MADVIDLLDGEDLAYNAADIYVEPPEPSSGIQPTSTVKRFSRKEGRFVNVERPNAIVDYNKHMGGTDLGDQNINRHRINIRGKK